MRIPSKSFGYWEIRTAGIYVPLSKKLDGKFAARKTKRGVRK